MPLEPHQLRRNRGLGERWPNTLASSGGSGCSTQITHRVNLTRWMNYVELVCGALEQVKRPGPSSPIPQYLGPDGDHRYEQRQRGERGGFLGYCFEHKKHGVHDCLQRNSPSPSHVPYQIDLEGQRFLSLVLEIPPLTALFQDFFTHPVAHPVPWQFHRNGMQVPLLAL